MTKLQFKKTFDSSKQLDVVRELIKLLEDLWQRSIKENVILRKIASNVGY